jgi:DNA replication and repair protein RecF
VVGENAQGKSNLIEAVYYLETFRSFRGSRDDRLAEFGQNVFRIRGELCREEETVHVSAAYQKSVRRKKVTVDDVEVERISDGIGQVGCVVFSPSDTALVSEGPGERRRFLDILLSLSRTGYLGALQRFRRVLAQRNAALKAGAPAPALGAWDGPLAKLAAAVVTERAGWCQDRGPAFGEYYARVSGGTRGRMEYCPSLGRGEESLEGAALRDPEEVEARIREGMEGALETDRRLGFTSVGPHRDELRITVETGDGTLDLRQYGSGGQRRTAALALRLVEADTIRTATGREPIVLMDDAFAELDEGRSERILDLLEAEERGQVILTAPKESDIRFRKDSLERRTIRNGRISG